MALAVVTFAGFGGDDEFATRPRAELECLSKVGGNAGFDLEHGISFRVSHDVGRT
jgi:hypothetical protein